MGNKVQLKKANEEVFEADLICSFEFNGKDYVFYTLNETVENGLVKMYVSEVGDDVSKLSQGISDEEWTGLKTVMKSIISGAPDVGAKYKKLGAVAYIQDVVKTIALKLVEQLNKIKAAFDAYIDSLPLAMGDPVEQVSSAPQPQVTAIDPAVTPVVDPVPFVQDNQPQTSTTVVGSTNADVISQYSSDPNMAANAPSNLNINVDAKKSINEIVDEMQRIYMNQITDMNELLYQLKEMLAEQKNQRNDFTAGTSEVDDFLKNVGVGANDIESVQSNVNVASPEPAAMVQPGVQSNATPNVEQQVSNIFAAGPNI